MATKKPEKSIDIIQIRWVDACSVGGWEPLAEGVKNIGAALCESVGYIVEKSEETITVCTSISADAIADKTTIPRSCVKQTKVIGKSYQKF